MPIERLDHFTILAGNVDEAVAFYGDILGFTPGPRPAFPFSGAWLYHDGRAVLHINQRPAIPESGVVDHAAFWGAGLKGFLSKMKTRGVRHELRRQPHENNAGVWQLFFFDPNGARIEIDFAANEEPGAQA